MGSIRIFGTPVEWGLTRERHSEITAELADHLRCIEEHEGPAPADKVAGALTAPAVRRRLSAAHLADQVYATLHRKPTRQEWRELGWLGFWFVLIVLSDVLAALSYPAISAAADHFTGVDYHGGGYLPVSSGIVALAFAQWILMAVARAGFFASFGVSLQRAWQTGWGVCLGRIIQLKLIHTVLVMLALVSIGSLLEKFSWGGYRTDHVLLGTTLPAWLGSPLICLTLACAGAAVWLLRRKLWSCGLFLIISALFLYPGGPGPARARQYSTTILRRVTVLSDGERLRSWEARQKLIQTPGLHFVREDPANTAEVAAWAEHLQRSEDKSRARGAEPYFASLDPAANKMVIREYNTVPLPWHISGWTLGFHGYELISKEWGRHSDFTLEPASSSHLIAPYTAPGGGVGWLAAPIPLLTLIGLCALVGLMGRRGSAHFLVYCLLAGLAMLTALMPFFAGQQISSLMERGPMALMHTPFPGFETLMVSPFQQYKLAENGLWGSTDYMGFTLIFGLLLSAAIPWLMTGLFLRPRSGSALLTNPTDREEGIA